MAHDFGSAGQSAHVVMSIGVALLKGHGMGFANLMPFSGLCVIQQPIAEALLCEVHWVDFAPIGSTIYCVVFTAHNAVYRIINWYTDSDTVE